MTTKQTLLKTLAATTLIVGLASGTAFAKKDGALRLDTNGDKQISQTEFLAGAEARFAETDANGDNFISDDERKAHREAKRTDRQDRRFEKTDLDNDGLISKDELEQARANRNAKKAERRDINGDGTVDKADRELFKEKRKAQKAERKERRDASAGQNRVKPDTNEDGFISLDEHMAAAERMFSFLDANADGVLTEGEGKRRKPKGKRGKKGYGS